MNWDKTAGHEEIKERLRNSIRENRISHAQLFSGKTGWGILPLALWYVREILISDKGEAVKPKIESLQYPDLHFTFPVSSEGSNTKPVSNDFIREWREFVFQHPYGNLFDWQEFRKVEKKQGIINVHEASEIVRFLALSSYEGSYKFCIIWMPETMNIASANKLLKVLEEPPKKTIFLLLTEREDLLLPTILSRCQTVKLGALSTEEVTQYLIDNKRIDRVEAGKIAAFSNGDLNEAIKNSEANNTEFETYFVDWVRNAFMAKKNVGVLKNLIDWSNSLSGWPREKQRQFLIYCSEVFRQAMLQTYQAESLVFMNPQVEGFKWEKFTPYIHGANIEAILNEINEGVYHIERNGNAKIVLLDLSIKLTRYLHRKVG